MIIHFTTKCFRQKQEWAVSRIIMVSWLGRWHATRAGVFPQLLIGLVEHFVILMLDRRWFLSIHQLQTEEVEFECLCKDQLYSKLTFIKSLYKSTQCIYFDLIFLNDVFEFIWKKGFSCLKYYVNHSCQSIPDLLDLTGRFLSQNLKEIRNIKIKEQ